MQKRTAYKTFKFKGTNTTKQTRPDQVRPNQPGQTKPDQARPDQTRPGQARPNQPGQTKPSQARPDQTRPDQTRPGQARLDQTTPDHESFTVYNSDNSFNCSLRYVTVRQSWRLLRHSLPNRRAPE